MQTKIRKAEGRLQVILDNIPDGIVIINPTENAEGPWLIEYCNRSFCEMNGFDRSDLIGKDIRVVSGETASDVELPDKRHEKLGGRPGHGETHRRAYYQRLKQGPVRIEEIHQRKDGSTFHIQAFFCLVQLGGQERVLGIDLDITESKQNEDQIQSLSKFPAENPFPVMRIAPDGSLLYANKSSEPLLAMWNIRIGQAMPPEWQAWNAEASHSGQNREVEIQCGERLFSCVLYPIKDPGYVNVYGRDITEHKLAEEALHESEVKYRNLFNNAEVGMFRTRLDGSEILDMNEKFLAIFGRTRAEMKGSTSILHWADPQERAEMVRRLAAENHVTDFECRLLNKQGEVRRCLASMRLYQEQGILEGSILDITERKQNELIQNAIYRITQTAIASDGMDALYHSIHAILGELIPAENFFLALYNSARGLISFPYYVDQYDEPPSAPIPLQGLTGYVIRTGRPLLATREVFDRLVQQGEVEVVGTVSVDWLGAPLKVEGRIIGVMAVQSYTQGIHFNLQDMHLLEFVSTQVAQTIERKRLEEEIRSLSLTDELTGLSNRRGFTLLAEQEVKLAQRIKKAMLLFFGDVDNLKAINDTWGHAQGDLALKEVSAILKESFRASDILARIGGDEFVALALDVSEDGGEILTHRIQDALEARNQQGDGTYPLSLSLGVARCDPDAPCNLDELIAQADGRMYLEKHAKKIRASPV